MPTLYKRKGGVERGKWTQENLDSAINEIKYHGSSLQKAEREFGVTVRTLRRISLSSQIMKKISATSHPEVWRLTRNAGFGEKQYS